MGFLGFTFGQPDADVTPGRSKITVIYANGIEFHPTYFMDHHPKIVREYFAFGEMIARYDKICKTDQSQIPTLIAACEGQIALADEHAKLCRREFPGRLPPRCNGYDRLVLTLESLGRLDEALAVAKRIARKEWEGQQRWPPRIARIKKKIATRDA